MNRFKLFVQGLRFGLIGGIATIVHIGIFTLCIEILGVRPFVANFPAFSIAVLVSFAGHFSWTFKHHDEHDRKEWMPALVKFIVVALLGLGMNSVIVYGVVNVAQLPYWYAIVLMVTVTPLAVFVLSKLWAFK